MDNLQQSIAACCKQLRLSSSLAERAMIQDGASHQEFLLGLLSDEIEYRRRARITKYLNTAGFPKRYEVGQFQPEEVIFPEETSLKSLLNLDFYHQGR